MAYGTQRRGSFADGGSLAPTTEVRSTLVTSMKIINLLINEDVLKAEIAFEQAVSDNIIELGRAYLALLHEYREQLHKLGELPEINLAQQSKLGRELVEQSRKAVRAAIEVTTSERNRVESLIEMFTLINGWDAAATFNRLKHKDSTAWELRGSEVRITGNGEGMKVEEAVLTAGLLRRQAYVADKTTFLR